MKPTDEQIGYLIRMVESTQKMIKEAKEFTPIQKTPEEIIKYAVAKLVETKETKDA